MKIDIRWDKQKDLTAVVDLTDLQDSTVVAHTLVLLEKTKQALLAKYDTLPPNGNGLSFSVTKPYKPDEERKDTT